MLIIDSFAGREKPDFWDYNFGIIINLITRYYLFVVTVAQGV